MKRLRLRKARSKRDQEKVSASLVFEARWSDGTQTRMTIYSSIDDLDVSRAIKVSRAAFSSRKRIPMAEITASIVQAHFETGGAVVRSCTTEELTS